MKSHKNQKEYQFLEYCWYFFCVSSVIYNMFFKVEFFFSNTNKKVKTFNTVNYAVKKEFIFLRKQLKKIFYFKSPSNPWKLVNINTQ